ncbi:MAG: DUF5615 family PIN-like protein [Alphaproteobacteria bacterium]|nr:DUF5615 family PIN-like protein [Alphaproteobacteria bacterium]MDE2112196.1 DUF5615 family PIN-like protein [Alphaproteobacteria bacterium]MDE2495827.1 DUF5615 family PIN-like protein [Alphaproteobacteria bacterium]
MVDECVHGYIIERLKASGHDVVLVSDVLPASDDGSILSMAREEHRILLTQALDFGEIVFRDRFLGVDGIVLLRMRLHPIALVWRRLEAAIDELGEGLIGRYVVVGASRFRSRPLK